MVIYLDVLAAVNLAMDYLLLLATARIAGVFVPRMRLLIGAAVGAAYAVCAVLPATTFLQNGLCELAAGVGMVALVFAPCKGRLVRVSVVFGLVSCACAGAVMALGRRPALCRKGAYYLDVPLRVVIVACCAGARAGCCFAAQLDRTGPSARAHRRS
ncbi:MAG: sigma-E processing peptidase SpoIIGA [Butyricicoccus pullicaecorum]